MRRAFPALLRFGRSRLHLDLFAIVLLWGAATACGAPAARLAEPTSNPAIGATPSVPATTPVARQTTTPSAGAALGKLTFIRNGDVWVKELPDGPERQVTNGGHFDQPRWSPSGTWLSLRQQADGDANAHLALYRADGTPSTAGGAPLLGSASWSPTDDRLAYVTPSGVEVIDPASGDRATLAGATSVAWSPDGAWLAYTTAVAPATPGPGSAPSARQTSLWRARPDGSDSREILSGTAAPASGLLLAGWSPDGRNVLVWPDPESSASLAADGTPLVAVPVDGGSLTQLTEAMLPRPDFLAWSPDGQRLALVGGAGRATWEQKALVVATLAGGQQRVSDGDRVDLFPAWSPDGQWLAVASAGAAPGVGGGDEAERALDQRRIWLMRPDGTDRRSLLEQSPARDERPRWSADGSRLLWVRVPQNGQPQVWLARVDRAEPPQLVADGLGLGTAAPAMGADEWFGFYGYVEWAALYDWWQPAPSV